MGIKRRLYCLVFCVFLSAVLLGIVCACCRAEASYPIYESELQSIRNELENIRHEKQSLLSDLTKSRLNLQQAEAQLTAIVKRSADLEQKLSDYQSRLANQETKLTVLLNMRRELQIQLTELNESFQQYKKEVERKIKKVCRQRNILAGIVIVFMVFSL
jgi:chromosome segregation ATPase